METITIIKEIKQFNYFDGTIEKGPFPFGEELWLSSPDYSINKNIFISIKDENNYIKFDIFSNVNKALVKNLSTFQFPKSGFKLSDLENLNKKLNLRISEKDLHGSQKLYTGYKLHEVFNLVYKKDKQKEFVLIMSIGGSRGPEYIYVHKCFEVLVNEDFKKLYFNKKLES